MKDAREQPPTNQTPARYNQHSCWLSDHGYTNLQLASGCSEPTLVRVQRPPGKKKTTTFFPPTHLWNLIHEALSQSALKTYSLFRSSKEARILLPSPSTLWSLFQHRAKPDLWDLFLLHSKVQHFKTTGGKDGGFLSCVTWPPLQCSPPSCSSLCPRGLHSSACPAAAAQALIPTSALLFLDAPPAATQIPS